MKRYINTLTDNYHTEMTGKILIGTPSSDDDFFDRSLIYIIAHDNQGALGVMFNKPLFRIGDRQLADEMKAASHLFLKKSYNVYKGGPVEEDKVMVLTYSSVQGAPQSEKQPLSLFLNATAFFHDLLSGQVDAPFLIVKGYCSWAPGQLDREMAENSWFIMEGDLEFVFDETSQRKKWNKALKKAGIKDVQSLKNLVSYTGHS